VGRFPNAEPKSTILAVNIELAPERQHALDHEDRGPHRIVDPRTGTAYVSSRFAVRRKLSNCVPFHAGEFGLTIDRAAQCENMLSIDQAQLDLAAGPIGVLDGTALRNVARAIGRVIESSCEPL
jgi:hypothetical protein